MTPREIALSICEPWFNGDPCEACRCHKVCTKLMERIETAIRAERVAEIGFGNMAQGIDFKETDHIPDATKMVGPVAYVSGYYEGRCVIKPVEPVLFPVGMALYRSPATSQESRQVEPEGYFSINDYGNWEQNESGGGTPLYAAPPKRKPLTDEQIEFRFGRKPTKYMMFLIRSTERAHGIWGGE